MLQSDEVIQELAAHNSTANDVGWFRFLCNYCLSEDVYADVSKSEKLMQLHSTAEQFDPTTEGLFHQMTVGLRLLVNLIFLGC